MNKIYSIVKKLAETSSTNDKCTILEAEKDNLPLMNYFYYALNPFIKFGVKKLPEATPLSESSLNLHADVIPLLQDLEERKLTGKKAMSAIQNLMEKMSEEEQYVFSCIVQKNPRCGVQAGLVNRVWEGLLPEEPKLMKAQSYSEKALSKITFPAISQKKCDGARCPVFCTKDSVKLFTSAGLQYHKLTALEEEVASLYEKVGFDFFLDGELLAFEDGQPLSRKISNGLANKSGQNTISETEAEKMCLVVWDFLPLSEYKSEKPSLTYEQTFEKLKGLITSNLKHIFLVESKLVNNKKEAVEHFLEMLARKEEGTILKNLSAKWENTRSKNHVKFKLVIETTMEVVDVFEGKEKYQGMLGGFDVKSSDGLVNVSVGSGFSDEQREYFWKNPPIGQFVEVKSNGLIRAENGEYSLFLPIFANMRPDKTVADDFKTIEELSTGSKMLAVNQ